MLIECSLQTYHNARGQLHTRNLYCYSCDQCQILFSKTRKLSLNKLHFCSNDCVKIARKKNGVLCNKQEKTNIAKFGSDRPMKSELIKEKRRKTSLQRYGVDNPMKVSKFCDKSICNMRSTFQTKYGVEHPLQVKEFADKAHTKAFETFSKFNAKSPAQMPGADIKRQSTCFVRYGVSHHWKNNDIVKKSIKTKERRGINLFKSTKIEQKIYDALQKLFPSDKIEHPKWFEGHPVDFYVSSIDTWIEHDGEFWHGLTKESKKYDWAIKRFNRDRQQDEKFLTLKMKLIRIFYSDVKDLSTAELESFLADKLCQTFITI